MTKRRGGRPSVYAQRRERLDTLVWKLTRDELRDGQPSADDLGARAVLADALAESGNEPLARALNAWPRDRGLYRTALLRKIQAAVRGPVERSTLDPLPRPTKILLALVDPRAPWVQVDRNVGGPSDGEPFVVEMGQGYSSYYGLVWAPSIDDAYEIAEDAFPEHFFEEVDEGELEERGDEGDVRPHPTKRGVWLVPDESAHYQTAIRRARRVMSARRLDRYGRQARLRSGEIVEFHP